MAWYGLDSITMVEKENNRDLILKEIIPQKEN